MRPPSAEPVLRSDVVRCQALLLLLASAAAASAEEVEGLLVGENLQFCDRDAGAVMLCAPWLFDALVSSASSIASSSGTVRILARVLLVPGPKPFSDSLQVSRKC